MVQTILITIWLTGIMFFFLINSLMQGLSGNKVTKQQFWLIVIWPLNIIYQILKKKRKHKW